LVGFAGSCGIPSSAEFQSILYGLHMTWGLSYRDITYEFDSQDCFTLIEDEVSPTDPYTAIIGHCGVQTLFLEPKFVHYTLH
jgi:hypothetical protein